MFIDRNAPTGMLGLGPSINEAMLHESRMHLIQAEASKEYFVNSALALARELADIRDHVTKLDNRIMAECQNGSAVMLMTLGLDSALESAINDLSLATGIPTNSLAPRYRLVQLESMREHSKEYWWDKRYINTPSQVISMMRQTAVYKPLVESIDKLLDPLLVDDSIAIPKQIAILANEARKQLIEHDGHFRL
jgi:hypothetical protein